MKCNIISEILWRITIIKKKEYKICLKSYFKGEIKVEEAYVGTALDELEKLFVNADAILEQIYPAAMEQCNDWDEEDFEGNTISLEYIRKYYELRYISITYAVGYGIYADLIGSVSDENGGELLGDHDFVAEYECKTGEISFDLWG